MRRRWVLAGIVAVGAVIAVAWWVRREPPPKTPPEVAINDPAVANVVAEARAAVLAKPKDDALWGKLGQTYLANGLPHPARDCFAEAGRLNPRDPVWPYLEGISLLLSDPVAALPCWQRAAECPGTDERAVTARLRFVEALLANNRVAEADVVLRGVLEGHPNETRAHFDLGLVAVARNDPGAAIESFQQCADNPAAGRKAATHLAALYAAQKNDAKAAEYDRRARELPPDFEWPDPFTESYLEFTVGRDALFIQAEKQHQQGAVRQALLLYQKVIDRYPDESRAYTKLGMLFAELGDYAAAESVLRAGLARSANSVQGHFFLAAALFPQAERLGVTTPAGREKLLQTVAAARRATELKPDHGFAHLYLGLAQKHLGQKVEALAELREAVRCTPEAADPHLHLGQALWDEGKADEAIAELETAVRLASPTDARPRAALERVKKAHPK